MKTMIDIKKLARPNVMALKPYTSARDDFKEMNANYVFLDANENPFNNGLNRYPDPQQNKLKEILSELKQVSKEQILLGNGSDEVLDLIFRVFCEPNKDSIAILPPTYGMYEVLANVNAVKTIKIMLTEDFQPNVEGILNAVDNTAKLLFLCSPNNPTANSFKASAIEELIQSFQGLVIIDEAYIDFSTQESWLSRLGDFPNLIVTQTLSKAYGLAGIRLGICYASKEIIALLNKIKPPYNINELTQQKALTQLQKAPQVQDEVSSILEQRELLQKELENIPYIEYIYPSDANFLLLKVDHANKRYEQLVTKGIVVRNRSKEPLCDNCLRITVGNSKENQILIQTLKNLETSL
ncbi:histidinol-phosphate transaminase [Mangrovimonas sp. DI 80]|uniref:histidinol-phosphate transaminase n=1 Tax=Mangrovimonas sp. DI 80 TaxID=1779330 RepID=UPI000976A5EF|nr:histidinol-phosphate transaminase [Mangrovimonas sp. DI 80]OMP30714.1 histidinol-phosphate transaminase [Mangrovimonas sp. DI 80]